MFLCVCAVIFLAEVERGVMKQKLYYALILIAVALNAFVRSDRSNVAVTIKVLQLTSQTDRGAFCNSHVVSVPVMPILQQIYKQNKKLVLIGQADSLMICSASRLAEISSYEF